MSFRSILPLKRTDLPRRITDNAKTTHCVSRDWISSDTECFREYNLAEGVILRDRVWSREAVG